MSLTKCTTHLDEDRSQRRRRWRRVISAPQTFRELFVSVRVMSSTQGTGHNKGQRRGARVQLDEILTVPPFWPPLSLVPTERLQRVPDQGPRASRTEGGEGVAGRARSPRLGGRKGAADGVTVAYSVPEK